MGPEALLLQKPSSTRICTTAGTDDGGIAPRQHRSNAGRRKNNGQNRSVNAELQRLKDELRLAGLTPTRPRLLIHVPKIVVRVVQISCPEEEHLEVVDQICFIQVLFIFR